MTFRLFYNDFRIKSKYHRYLCYLVFSYLQFTRGYIGRDMFCFFSYFTKLSAGKSFYLFYVVEILDNLWVNIGSA